MERATNRNVSLQELSCSVFISLLLKAKWVETEGTVYVSAGHCTPGTPVVASSVKFKIGIG